MSSLLSNSILFDLLSLLVTLIVISITYMKWVHQYWKRRNVPYIKPKFFYGNLEPFSKQTMTRGILIKKYYDQMKSQANSKYFGFYIMLKPVFTPIDLDLIKTIFTKDFDYFVNRGAFINEKNEALSAHLISLVDDEWRNLRTKLTPAFTLNKIKSMIQIIYKCGQELEKFLNEKSVNNEVIDVKDVTNCYTIDVIGSCAFGLECNSLQDKNSPFYYYSTKFFQTSFLTTIFDLIIFNFPKLSKLLKLKIVSKDVSDFYMKVIRDTVNYRLTNNVDRKDFLQLLIDLKLGDNQQALTIDQMTGQSFLFFLAGFETTSILMTFTLYELARNQDIQDKVRNEIKTILEKYSGEVTYDSISEMTYLSQVIDESLRKYPPGPFIERKCSKNYHVPNSDVIIEKDSCVILPIYALHHDPEYYPNPHVFDPERFSEENKLKRNQYTYLPFGEGPRNCIGIRFALTNAKIGLASFLKNYQFFVNSKTKEPLKIDVFSELLNAEGGVWLDVKKIT